MHDRAAVIFERRFAGRHREGRGAGAQPGGFRQRQVGETAAGGVRNDRTGPRRPNGEPREEDEQRHKKDKKPGELSHLISFPRASDRREALRRREHRQLGPLDGALQRLLSQQCFETHSHSVPEAHRGANRPSACRRRPLRAPAPSGWVGRAPSGCLPLPRLHPGLLRDKAVTHMPARHRRRRDCRRRRSRCRRWRRSSAGRQPGFRSQSSRGPRRPRHPADARRSRGASEKHGDRQGQAHDNRALWTPRFNRSWHPESTPPD